jgi:hypothetical protein
MAMIQANAEKAAQNAVLTKTRQQKVEIADLHNKNITLLEEITALRSEKIIAFERIDTLSSENIESIKTIKSFQTRCAKYKDHMNDVVKAQKQLNADAKVLRRQISDLAHAKAMELYDSYRIAEEKRNPIWRFKDSLKEANKFLADRRYRCFA